MMAEGTRKVEQHTHTLVVAGWELEVIYRALVHRWHQLERNTMQPVTPSHPDYEPARALTARIACELIDGAACAEVRPQ